MNPTTFRHIREVVTFNLILRAKYTSRTDATFGPFSVTIHLCFIPAFSLGTDIYSVDIWSISVDLSASLPVKKLQTTGKSL